MPAYYSYKIIIPSGNDTAIVEGINYNKFELLQINNAIMQRHKNVEQVGFVSSDPASPIFFMAGGGFCGNGTRAATFHILDGRPGAIKINIPEVVVQLPAGIAQDNSVWTEVPLNPFQHVERTDEGYYLVRLPGVAHIVILPSDSRRFLNNRQSLLKNAYHILEEKKLTKSCSCGVVFTENSFDSLRIHPCVYDYGVKTMIQESACRSGTTAAAIVLAEIQKKDAIIAIQQPSGEKITAEVRLKDGRIQKASISGKVYCDNHVYSELLSE